MSNQDLLLKQLHDLHSYIRLLGEHINQIHGRLDQLEQNISEMKSVQSASIKANRAELEDIMKVIASKAEVNGLFQELNSSLTGSLPALPVRTVEEPEVVEETNPEERLEQENLRKEDRRRRFPFLRRS